MTDEKNHTPVPTLVWQEDEIKQVESLFSEMNAALAGPNADAKIKLWFFRDMFESNRLALFSLFGFKAADIDTMGKQNIVFRRILADLVEQSTLGKNSLPEPTAWLLQGDGWGKELMFSEQEARDRAERLKSTWTVSVSPLYPSPATRADPE